MYNGYFGKVLRIDVSNKTFCEELIDSKLYRILMGGSCLAAYFFIKEQKYHVDPFSEDNLLILATGPVSGIQLPGTAILSIMSKSPATGGLHESLTPGLMAEQIKKAGYDAIIIRGKSEEPLAISIRDNGVMFIDARNLWGVDTADAIDALKGILESGASICTIGVAGENLVKYASIVHDYMFNTSRGGLGAVMGSKGIKALAIEGTGEILVHDRKTIVQYGKRFTEHFLENPVNKGHFEGGGHAGFIHWMCQEGILSTRNARYTGFEGSKHIDGGTIAEKLGYENLSCANCCGGCKRIYKEQIEGIENRFGAPELETLSSIALGSEIDDMEYALRACDLTMRYGLDGTSTGVVLAFANECYENGILNKKDVDGLELGFGNCRGALSLIDRIAHRDGIGDVLAEGVSRASREIGEDSPEFALHVKGMEVPLHDPRIKAMLGLGYAVTPNGPIYTTVEHDTDFDYNAPELFMQKVTPLTIFNRLESHLLGPEKVRMFSILQPAFSMLDVLGACIFAYSPVRYFDYRDLVGIVDAITGWESSLYELVKAGERRTTLLRHFNVRAGLSTGDDMLPNRYFHPIEKGPKKGYALNKSEFEEAKKLYFRLAGIDCKTGMPTSEKLIELGIEGAVQ